MFRKKHAYALVLSGGGAKGAYEIGAWKAFKELGITFDAVCGASVGALNAAIIAQDDFDLGVKLWSEITISKVVDIPEGFLQNGKPKLSLKTLSKIGDLNLNFKNLGLDSSPLHNLLKEVINETKIRKSGMDLGIVTIDVKNLKPCEIFLETIPEGTLPDYLLASASFPAFKRAEIDGKLFADGGLYDNIPHAMAKNRGYRRIVVIDIEGPGFNKRPDIIGTDTTYIQTSMPIGGVLDFNPEKAKRAIELGCLDTMKVFGKNDGIKYFIQREPKLEKDYYARLLNPDYIKKYQKHLKKNGRKCSPQNAEELIRERLPKELRNNKNLLLCLIEAAACSLDIERLHLYKTGELIDIIRKKYRVISQSGIVPSSSESESFIKRLELTIEGTLSLFRSDRELSDYCPYEYAMILKKTHTAESLFPELIPAEIFLCVL